MKTIVNYVEELEGEKIEGLFQYENKLCICTETKALPLEYDKREKTYVSSSANLNGDIKVHLGIMTEQEYAEKKAVFDSLKKDFLTTNDKIIAYASKLQW